MLKNKPSINMSQEHFAHLLEKIQELQLYIANGRNMTSSQKTVVEKALCKCLDLLNPTKKIKF